MNTDPIAKENTMSITEDEIGLTTGEKHALRLGIQLQTTGARSSADRLAEQADGEDPSWADTVRIAADTAAAKRAADHARFLEQEAARTRARDEQLAAAKPAGTTRGKVAAALIAEQAADRAEEDAAAAEYRRAEAEARAARGSAGQDRELTLWEKAQARARLAQLARDDAA
jgi:hypothetical protein